MKQELIDYLGLKMIDGDIVGERDGYYFNVVQINVGVMSDYMMFVFPETVKWKIRMKIQKAVKTDCQNRTFKTRGDTLMIRVPYKALYNAEKHFENCAGVLGRTIEAFKTLGLKQSVDCSICGRNDGEDFSRKIYKHCYVTVHDHCVKEMYASAIQGIQNQKVEKLPLSILLAAVGAVIGLIPTIIGIMAKNEIYALLYALIPLAAFGGYRLGGAPRKNYMIAVIIAVSVLSVAGMELIDFGLEAALLHMTISEAWSVKENQILLLTTIGQGLLFLLLGTGIVWKIITNTDEKKLEEIKKMNK